VAVVEEDQRRSGQAAAGNEIELSKSEGEAEERLRRIVFFFGFVGVVNLQQTAEELGVDVWIKVANAAVCK